jgi:hypothetical protein
MQIFDDSINHVLNNSVPLCLDVPVESQELGVMSYADTLYARDQEVKPQD